jgi:hypothetical protein
MTWMPHRAPGAMEAGYAGRSDCRHGSHCTIYGSLRVGSASIHRSHVGLITGKLWMSRESSRSCAAAFQRASTSKDLMLHLIVVSAPTVVIQVAEFTNDRTHEHLRTNDMMNLTWKWAAKCLLFHRMRRRGNTWRAA